MDDLKRTYPQKYYLKKLCKYLYYFGLGECWYEETHRNLTHKRLYAIWSFISNFYIFIIIVNEFLAHFRSDLTEKEKNDLVLFNLAHPSIASKILAVYIKKDQIKMVLKRFLEDTRMIFSNEELDRQCTKNFIRNSVTLTVFSYLVLMTSTLDGIRSYLNEGIPIRIVVPFYPKPSGTGTLLSVMRFFVEFHWWYMVSIMILIDIIAFGSLIFLGYRFKLLQLYFNNLRNKFMITEGKSQRVLEEEFRRDFIVGIKLHEDTLWCARNIQVAMGSFYSIQILESVTLLVMCLIKLVAVERNLTYLLASSLFIICLIVITGIYMMAAGDVTDEAALVSTAIFHCGWELTTSCRDLRVLTVLALQRSQVPVFMTAFGLIILSYSNFISVLRSSYSFFAVMY